MRALAAHWRSWWEVIHEEHSDYLDRIPPSWVAAAVFVASALTLYVEMVMVRWHSTCFHVFAIFKNVSLLSCFLGLGIGYGLSSRRRITLALFLPLLALQTVLFGVLSNTTLGSRIMNPVAEQLVMGKKASLWSWVDAVDGNLLLAVVFVINAVMFIPLGQLTGKLMDRLPKVKAYSLNLLGSLTGIGLFFVLSLLWTRPMVWMGLAALGLAPFLIGHRRSAAIGVGCMAAILIGLGIMGRNEDQQLFSPYQVISLRLPRTEDQIPTPSIRVNHSYYQDIMDCSPAAVAASPKNAASAASYNFPYRLRPNPGSVVVVGAGTGNDVAAALRNGARSVTAVEIDPAILFLGQRLHLERPYQDPRTTTVVNDARSFLRQTHQRFDVAVYGLLDSHTNLGAMTNVRLDSFVYTMEGFREAIARLNDDGLLVVSYTVLDPKQGEKLYAMLRDAYPEKAPRAFASAQFKDGGQVFVSGPGLARLPERCDADSPVKEITAQVSAAAATAEVATDDWPFFYMKERAYPVSYAAIICLLLVLSAWLVKRNLGSLKVTNANSACFFFLGAGFMLIETKGITELGLVFGNTWSVVAIVITGILLMGYLANQWVWRRGPVPAGWAFGLLGASLLLGLFVTRLSSAGVSIPLPKLVMPLVLTLPLLFAGLIFSSKLVQGGGIGEALSANIFGAMLGGFLEYNSMYWGFSSLYPLGMGLYALAFVSHWRAQQQQAASVTDAPMQARTAA
jgi:spermidine synthase